MHIPIFLSTPTRPLFAHMGALKIDLGTRACDFHVTSWCDQCEVHQVLVTLEAEREVNIAHDEVPAPHFPCCSGPVAIRLFSVLRELFSRETSPCLRSKCQVSLFRPRSLEKKDSSTGSCDVVFLNVPSYKFSIYGGLDTISIPVNQSSLARCCINQSADAPGLLYFTLMVRRRPQNSFLSISQRTLQHPQRAVMYCC